MNCIVRAKGRVICPDPVSPALGSGSVVGGEIIAMRGLVANSLGSDLAKMTKVVCGVDFEYEKTVKNLNKGVEFCESETAKLSKFLKLGFQDFETVKKRIAKLPKEKQKPFVQAFKRLGEVSRLMKEIAAKKERYFAGNEELARKAEVVVRKELFPRVNIQIGDARILTTESSGAITLKLSKSGKNIAEKK